MKSLNGPLRVGIGGPVGSGKTTLCEMLLKAMRDRYSMAVVTNDIYTREDALILARVQAISEDRIVGVETGGCPHTAIREDASLNLAAIAELNRKFPDLDIGLIESGGDNLAATFSPDLVDIALCDLGGRRREDTAYGRAGDHPLDLRIINKADLAPYVNASLEVMESDTKRVREGRPYVFTDMLRRDGLDDVIAFIERMGGLAPAHAAE